MGTDIGTTPGIILSRYQIGIIKENELSGIKMSVPHPVKSSYLDLQNYGTDQEAFNAPYRRVVHCFF